MTGSRYDDSHCEMIHLLYVSFSFIQNDTAVINVTVLNVNDWDPRFQMPEYDFMVTESLLPVGAVIGRVFATDEDIGDQVTLQLKGPEARYFP